MSISVETRGRPGVDLNLVPFVDFLSCILAFLLLNAVLVDVSTLGVEPHAGDGEAPEAGPPPLTMHVSAAGVWVGRHSGTGTMVARAEAAVDWSAVDALLAADRAAWPDQRLVVLNTDDGESYGDTIRALDLSRTWRYEDTLIAGGPPTP